jgi:hypothetical protein
MCSSHFDGEIGYIFLTTMKPNIEAQKTNSISKYSEVMSCRK